MCGDEEAVDEGAQQEKDTDGEHQNDDRDEDRESDRHAAEKWFHPKPAIVLLAVITPSQLADFFDGSRTDR